MAAAFVDGGKHGSIIFRIVQNYEVVDRMKLVNVKLRLEKFPYVKTISHKFCSKKISVIEV